MKVTLFLGGAPSGAHSYFIVYTFYYVLFSPAPIRGLCTHYEMQLTTLQNLPMRMLADVERFLLPRRGLHVNIFTANVFAGYYKILSIP